MPPSLSTPGRSPNDRPYADDGRKDVVSGRQVRGPKHESPAPFGSLTGLALGLRLLALAVVAGSGALLLRTPEARTTMAAGILASALLGLAQAMAARRGARAVGQTLVLAQVAVWIRLIHISGGAHSPLFVGLLLEVPLAGTHLGRRGCILGAASAAGAYIAYALLAPVRPEPYATALVIGSIAASSALTWMLLGNLERQRRASAAARTTLAMRAEKLEAELGLLGDSLGGALLTVDDMGRVVSINQPGATLLGMDRRDALGRPWQHVLRPNPDAAECLTRTLAGGLTQRHVTVLLQRADGVPVAFRGDL